MSGWWRTDAEHIQIKAQLPRLLKASHLCAARPWPERGSARALFASCPIISPIHSISTVQTSLFELTFRAQVVAHAWDQKPNQTKDFFQMLLTPPCFHASILSPQLFSWVKFIRKYFSASVFHASFKTGLDFKVWPFRAAI